MAQLVWLITGCSSGFGTAFVHSLLARGDKVIATGRNAETKLAHLKDTGCAILDLDVTATQTELDAKIHEAIEIFGHIDGLINNAGYGVTCLLEELTQEQWDAQLNTNLFGCIRVTKALLPHFRSRRSGKIAFTSSIYSFISSPGSGPYCVSKHALLGYAKTLNDEVAQFGIKTTIFDIGHFRTNIIQNKNLAATKMNDYKPMWKDVEDFLILAGGNQPGDPMKGVERMIDVLKLEGMAKGKGVPLRVPIGADAVKLLRDMAMGVLKACDDWGFLSEDIDLEGPKQGWWAQ